MQIESVILLNNSIYIIKGTGINIINECIYGESVFNRYGITNRCWKTAKFEYKRRL